MKKLFTILLAVTMLLSICSAFAVNASAAFPTVDKMDGYENLCLTYTWNPNRQDNGRHNPEDLMPYVAYYGTDGKIQDFFFDSYLFLPCVQNGVTGARLHYDPQNPTKAADWTAYVKDTFHDGTNVDALDVAFGRAKAELNAPDKKAGVFFSILYPGVHAGSSFGSLGGKQLDFSKFDDRKYAIKWIIDEQVRLYNEGGYDNLDLVGFYWLEEYLYEGDIGTIDVKLFKYASDYLHSLGMQFIWIPYFRTNGYKRWRELGFDTVCMQPNMYWQVTADPKRVDVCIDDCSIFGMGVEIEIDHRAINNGEYYNRYLDYLEGCMQEGAMDSIKMYYQDGKSGVYYDAWRSTNARARSIYDLTYKYAKGTLTQADIDDNRSDILTLAEEIDWVSIGKSYVASTPYSDGSAVDYQNNSGTELTDGILGASDLGTEWHAFHITKLDPDGRMNVTIDLGEVYNDLTHFLIQFSHIEKYGIDDPADDVKIYISENGTDFTLLAEPSLEYVDTTSYVTYDCEPVSARYVKYSLVNSNANFVFCGEAAVGVDKEEVSEPDDNSTTIDVSSEVSSEVSDISSITSIGGADETNVDISVSSEVVDDDKSDNSWILWVCIGVAVVIITTVVAVVIVKKKNK